MICFVSGHLDLTPEEFEQHYVPQLAQAVQDGCSFVLGDAKGADAMAQLWLSNTIAEVTVFHMFDAPRHTVDRYERVGGFLTDHARDAAMTAASHHDIAWVRPGKRPNNGTALNLRRRKMTAIHYWSYCGTHHSIKDGRYLCGTPIGNTRSFDRIQDVTCRGCIDAVTSISDGF